MQLSSTEVHVLNELTHSYSLHADAQESGQGIRMDGYGGGKSGNTPVPRGCL